MKVDTLIYRKLNSEIETQLKSLTKNNICNADRKFEIDSIRATILEISQGYLTKYNKLIKPIKLFENFTNADSTKINEIIGEIDILQKKYNELNKEIDSVFDFKNKSIKKVEDLCESTENLINFSPELTNILGGGGLVLPSANLLGNKQFKRGPLFGVIKLFSTSVVKDKPTDWRSMAIPENSAFGIQTDITWALRHKEGPKNGELKNTAFHFGFNYLTKRGFRDTLTSNQLDYDFALLHMKVGLNYIAFKNVMEIYGDYNIQHIVTNLGTILNNAKNLYDQKNNLGFINTGIRFNLDLSGILSKASNQKSLVFDLNLNWVSQQLKAISPNTIDKAKQIVSNFNNVNNSKDKATQLVIPMLKLALKL